jgi:MFS superfamily sulfate permease-like transporter
MKLLKMLGAIIIGTIIMIWSFLTFIAQDNHVSMTRDATGIIHYALMTVHNSPMPNRAWNIVAIGTDGITETMFSSRRPGKSVQTRFSFLRT